MTINFPGTIFDWDNSMKGKNILMQSGPESLIPATAPIPFGVIGAAIVKPERSITLFFQIYHDPALFSFTNRVSSNLWVFF